MQAAVPSVTLLIPAYNEEGALADTVATIERQREHVPNLEIIVINDGSTDRTSEVARSLQVTLIDHETNRGYGASLKDGMLRATSEYILIADADGTYPLEDIRGCSLTPRTTIWSSARGRARSSTCRCCGNLVNGSSPGWRNT